MRTPPWAALLLFLPLIGRAKGGTGGILGTGNDSAYALRHNYTDPREYSVIVLKHFGSRRRAATFYDSADGGTCSAETDETFSNACANLMSNETECFGCMSCEDETCMDNITGCSDLLYASFYECCLDCDNLDTIYVVLIITGLALALLSAAGICYFVTTQNQKVKARVAQAPKETYPRMSMERARMKASARILRTPVDVELVGTFRGAGVTTDNAVRYSLTINPDGLVTGTGSRPVRPSGMDLQITGKVQMDREGPGEIRWQEVSGLPTNAAEICGDLMLRGPEAQLRATFSHFDGRDGSLQASGNWTVRPAPAEAFPFQPIVTGEAVGQPMPPSPTRPVPSARRVNPAQQAKYAY